MPAKRSAWRMALATGALVVGGLAACGDDGDTSATTTEASTTTTTTIEASTTTTTEATTTTVDQVVAWIRAQLDEEFAQSTPPSGVTGPSQISCADTGTVEVGGVLACTVEPATEPPSTLETGSAVIYILDASGRAAFDVATDIPGSTERLMARYDQVPKGLLCRDLLAADVDAYPFSQRSTPSADFFWSLVYWSLEGEPDRMDADGNGIPCETLYEPEVIAQVLDGGRVP